VSNKVVNLGLPTSKRAISQRIVIPSHMLTVVLLRRISLAEVQQISWLVSNLIHFSFVFFSDLLNPTSYYRPKSLPFDGVNRPSISYQLTKKNFSFHSLAEVTNCFF